MFLKRTSPNLTLPLAGELEFGDRNPFQEVIVPPETKANQAGVYIPPSHHKRRIPFLEKAGQLIVDALSNPFDYDLGHMFWHKDKTNKNGGYRKVRSESRESITLRIGKFIMHHVNLATMSLGFFAGDEFRSYDYEGIAKTIGINISEVKRSIARFIKEGYVSVEQRREKRIDGSYRSLTPIIKISLRLFYDLGFDMNQVMFHVERAEKALLKEKAKKMHKDKKPAFFPGIVKQSKIARRALAEIMSNLASKLKTNTS